MTIDLSGLQIFNNAIQNNRDLNGGTRIACESTQDGMLGRFNIKQIPANKYIHNVNNTTRRNFADALTSAFGVASLNELPKDVRDVLKIEDFKLQDGNVTSSRPLTMRRIRAVMNAIRDVTAKAAPSQQEASNIRDHFTDYLQRSEYMEAAFDRIAIAEGRKPLTLDMPLISNNSFDIPLSALKVYTKGIKPAELASKINEIKERINADVMLADDTLTQIKQGNVLPPDANRANALRNYFALCAVASDETGRGISRTISVPDENGKIAAFLMASLKDADNFETGVVHMPADPFLSESKAVTRFSVNIGFKESAGFGEAWHVAYNTYEALAMQDGFSPLMRRGVEPAMSIAQMYSNITAENTRLLNAYSAEMDALFEKHPDFANAQQNGALDPSTLPPPFNSNIGKILSLRQTLNTFFSNLTLANPAYADHPEIRYADETILTSKQIPAMAKVGVPLQNEAVAAAQIHVAAPYEGLTLDNLLDELMTKAPPERKTNETRYGWAVASLLSELPAARLEGKNFESFFRQFGKEGVPEDVMQFMRTLEPRELYVSHLCVQCLASNMQVLFTTLDNSAGPNVNLYNMLMNGELPLTVSVDFLKSISQTAEVMTSTLNADFESGEFTNAQTFTEKTWGFNTSDIAAIAKFVKDCGYDLDTITKPDLQKLMALARLRDFRFDDLSAFYHRVLHKDVQSINNNDLKTLFKLYRNNKLIDPLTALKPGRTLDTINLFKGDKLPSSTNVSGKDMVRMIATLRTFAKEGGAKEATLRFNDKPVTLKQSENGRLYITVNGMKIAGAQTAAGFINIFESDMVSNVKRFGVETILKMLPELSTADIADAPNATSHTREICLRIVADRLELPASSFATVPTAMLRTIASNALKGYYSTETGAINKNVAAAVLSANTRNDVFTGEEIRDIHSAMVRTNVEELNRKVILAQRPAPRPNGFNLFLNSQARLAATQEKARNLLADLIMNADIISYDEAQRKGEGDKRVLNLIKTNLDTFIDVIMNPTETLAGLAEPMRTVLVERFTEMTAALPRDANAGMAQKALYKAAFTIMLEIAELPEADRAAALQTKIDNNKMLKGALLLSRQVTVEQLSNTILDILPQITGLDAVMDNLVHSAMEQIQTIINDKLNAGAPEEPEAGDVEPRNEAPIWQQSFDRLVGGALTDSSCGYGKFMNEVLSRYFINATPQEGRQMLASLFRNTDANSTSGQVVGALFKGAGPLLQKMLQALPSDAFGEDMRDALKDMKSNLQPIPETIVKAHLLDIVNRSNGAIKSIEVIRSLGAASVGQAFLCKMITDEHPNGEECVVKMLRPNVKTIIESERQRFVDAAKATPGMEKTFEGQYARILEELDFTKEKTNINFARNVYEQPVMIYTDGLIKTTQRVVTMNKLHSMEVHPSVPPTMDTLILKKAPGETYDRFMANARTKTREILRGANPATGKANFNDPGSLRAAQTQLITLYNETKKRQDYLLLLTEKWVQEALYGNGFYHGDLHAGNIMTDGEGLTVIDFGNATHLTQEERTHVLKMMAAAMYGRENYFEQSFRALISAEGRAVYDSKNTAGELTRELHEILNKGTTTDAGRRIFAALMCLQRHGIEIPGPIYNFAQCQMRLGGAVEEMNTLMNELQLAMSQLAITPLNTSAIPENTPTISPGVRDAFNALKAFINHEGDKSYVTLAKELEPHFGSHMVGGNRNYEAERLPNFIRELQTAFTDRATFDTYLLPFVERLTEAKTCNIFNSRDIDIYTSHGDTLRQKLNTFLAIRETATTEQLQTATQELANAFIRATRTYQQAMTMIAPDREPPPEDGAFVYAIANIVNANLRPALKSLGTMSVPIFLEMLSAKSKEAARTERTEGSAAKIQTYIEQYTSGTIDADTVKTIANIAQDFQHPLELPGLNGKSSALKSTANRALFLTTLKFNLNLLENALREEGLLNETTPADKKTHFVRIAMQLFADRVGGIDQAVKTLSNANYANLYDEAYAQELNHTGLLVRDAIIHLRNPIQP